MACSGRIAMANRVRPITVTEADRHELERLQRSPSIRSGLSRRARAAGLGFSARVRASGAVGSADADARALARERLP